MKDPLDEKPAHWEPDGSERQMYRDVTSGDLGYLVRRGGRTMWRMDRPSQEIVRPYHEMSHAPEGTHRPLSRWQAVRVAYEADRGLCKLLGMHNEARAEWPSLSEDERLRWRDSGPTDRPERIRLYRAVTHAMREFTD